MPVFFSNGFVSRRSPPILSPSSITACPYISLIDESVRDMYGQAVIELGLKIGGDRLETNPLLKKTGILENLFSKDRTGDPQEPTFVPYTALFYLAMTNANTSASEARKIGLTPEKSFHSDTEKGWAKQLLMGLGRDPYMSFWVNDLDGVGVRSYPGNFPDHKGPKENS